MLTFDTISAATMAEQAKKHILKNMQDSVFKRGFGAASISQVGTNGTETCLLNTMSIGIVNILLSWLAMALRSFASC